MFSNTSPRHSFFEGPSANLASKTHFWSHLRSRSETQSALGATCSVQKVDFGVVVFRGGGILDPTWPRFGAERVPSSICKRFLDPSCTHFKLIWANFTRHLNTFSIFWGWFSVGFLNARFWVTLSQNSSRNKLLKIFHRKHTENTTYFL